MMSTMDHGILNLPISKRGNIDAQIDAFKRDQAAKSRADAKQASAELELLRIAAKDLIGSLSSERLEGFAKKLGSTSLQARKKLLSEAHWNPKAIISVFGGKA